MLTPDDVIAEARRWIGTRWVHQGRTTAGIDCAGLLVCVLRNLGQEVEDMQGYRRSPDGESFRANIYNQTDYQSQPSPGAIGLFREAIFPTHTGFFAEQNGILTLIHAYSLAGKVVEEPFQFRWPEKLVAVRKIRGLVD